MRNTNIKNMWCLRPHTFSKLLVRHLGPQTSSGHNFYTNLMFLLFALYLGMDNYSDCVRSQCGLPSTRQVDFTAVCKSSEPFCFIFEAVAFLVAMLYTTRQILSKHVGGRFGRPGGAVYKTRKADSGFRGVRSGGAGGGVHGCPLGSLPD